FFLLAAERAVGCFTLSLHDALPISARGRGAGVARRPRKRASVCAGGRDWSAADRTSWLDRGRSARGGSGLRPRGPPSASDPLRTDRKSTRLNSSHVEISYAVFCLKK